jgi:hypothetical protein
VLYSGDTHRARLFPVAGSENQRIWRDYGVGVKAEPTKKLLALALHYWKALAVAFGAVTFLSTMGPMIDWIRNLSAIGIEMDGSRMVLGRMWSAGLVTLGFLFLAGLAATFTLFFERELQRKENKARETALRSELETLRTGMEEEVCALRRQNELTTRSLLGTTRAGARIVNHFYPALDRPPYVVDEVSFTRTIHANGDNELKARLRVRAYGRPLHFWRINVSAESEATGIEYLDEIDFRIVDDSNAEPLSYLVTRNDVHSKEISAFFLPFLLPEEAAREIMYTYRWPGMSQKLLRRGSETFNLTTRSQGTLQKVEYCLYFDPALHRSRDLGCEVIGMRLPGASLKAASSDAGWKGWRYEATDVPAGSDFDCQIEVRAKR